MYRNAQRICLALALLAALSACGTTPNSKHYLLRARELPPAAAGNPLSLGIGPVSVPEYLRRNTMIYATDGNRVNIALTERWAEPLADGILRVLSLNLGGLLATQDVRGFPWNPRRAPEYGVEVRVLQLDASPGAATLIADWLLFRPADDAEIARRTERLEVPLAGGTAQAEGVAQAYSDLFYHLSEKIAAAVRAAHDQGPHNEN